jgi:flavodoxin I
MTKIGIFYGSSTGNTQMAAEKIASHLGGAEIHNIRDTDLATLSEYDVIILGSSTWGWGDIQDDWQDHLSNLSGLDLSGKMVAYFGTGNQYQFSSTFGDALSLIHDGIKVTGARHIGTWPVDGYEHSDSKAVEGSQFIGLLLDEENQSDLTDERIHNWTSKLKEEIVS